MIKILMKFTVRRAQALSTTLDRLMNQDFQNWEELTSLRLATLLDPGFRKTGFTTPEVASKSNVVLSGNPH